MNPRPVAVLAGGPSSEREISLRSAASVLEHLPRDRHIPIPVEILPDALWVVAGGEPVFAEAALAELRRRGVQMVFPALHGPFGEDGTVQGFLEVAGMAYVGSGVAASALAMDKSRTREVVTASGIRVPRGLEITGGSLDGAVDAVLAELPLPVAVKGPTGGSSYEVEFADDAVALRSLLAGLLSRPGGRALVEERVRGVELTCAVLGNVSTGGEIEALPVVRIVLHSADTFDTASKYDPAAVDEECPAAIDDALAASIRALALRVHRTLRCDGLTRSDFLVPEDGVPRFLEVNTLPGLTAESIAPKAALAAGITFPALLDRLIGLAWERFTARAQSSVTQSPA